MTIIIVFIGYSNIAIASKNVSSLSNLKTIVNCIYTSIITIDNLHVEEIKQIKLLLSRFIGTEDKLKKNLFFCKIFLYYIKFNH